MKHLSPDPVNNLADKERTSSPDPATTPSPYILSSFEPQSYPLSRREKIELTLQWAIGAAIAASIGWALWS